MTPNVDKAAVEPDQADRPLVLEARNVFRMRQIEGREMPIVRDVSFGLQKGEFATIMGPSGSGKSTLLHLLAGLDSATAGDVVVAGENLSGGDEEFRANIRRRRIGFIFQFFNLLPDLTVEENVTLPLRILGQSPKKHRDRVSSLFSLLGVSKLRDRLPSGLSGGEMQRVSIARALVTQPELVLADEPTGNLDSGTGEAILDLIQALSERHGIALVIVTHSDAVTRICHRVFQLCDGRIYDSVSS